MKVNLGCGADHKEGFTNIDFNKESKADIIMDFSRKIDLKTNSVEYLLMNHVIEHIPSDNIFDFMDEVYRVCKPNAIVEIFTPHYSGMYAFKHLGHYRFFGIGSFDMMGSEMFNAEKYNKAKFRAVKEDLHFFHHNLISTPWLSKLPINWMFNFNRTWQLLMEKFFFIGFDEIHYKLRAIK